MYQVVCCLPWLRNNCLSLTASESQYIRVILEPEAEVRCPLCQEATTNTSEVRSRRIE